MPRKNNNLLKMIGLIVYTKFYFNIRYLYDSTIDSNVKHVSQSVSQFYSILKKEDRACKNRVSGLMCERGGGNVKGKFVKGQQVY